MVDCRPQKNAVGNVAKGGGWEVADHYPYAKVKFLSIYSCTVLCLSVNADIENIHVVRDCFNQLRGLFLLLNKEQGDDPSPTASNSSGSVSGSGSENGQHTRALSSDAEMQSISFTSALTESKEIKGKAKAKDTIGALPTFSPRSAKGAAINTPASTSGTPALGTMSVAELDAVTSGSASMSASPPTRKRGLTKMKGCV